MSTTDKPTWLLAERFRDVPAIEEAITNFAHDQTGDNATGIVLAVLEHQAATEAAKATGTAGELPPLPEEIEVGGEGWGWEDFQSEKTFSVEHMLYYGAACAQAAFAEAARQPAPVLPVKTWRERWQEIFKMLPPVYSVDACTFMQNEIEDLRAALAATAAPVLPKNPLYTCIGKGGEYELIGTAQGAGTMKKLDDMRIYRAGNRLYYRTTDDFDARMQRIAATRSQP